MSRHAATAKAAPPPEPTPLPPEVLVVARATTMQGGTPCVAALLVRGKKVTRSVVIEGCREGAAADRSWREWAWRLLWCGEAFPVTEVTEFRTARGMALAKSGKTWGALHVAIDPEGIEVSAVGTGDTKADAWDELDRYAALHLLDDERRARLRGVKR